MKNLTVKEAREFLKEQGYFTQNLWTAEDVIVRAKQMEEEISEEQAIEIFDLIGRRFNAEIGVNWDVIDNAIEEFLN